MSHKKTFFDDITCYLKHQSTWGFILIGFGIGIIMFILLPVNVWLFALAVGALAYGIYCVVS